MISLWRPALAASFLFSLAACAVSPTPYGPSDGRFGYSEQQLESDRYRVSFVGNSATSRDAVENSALYRAAELTLQKGHDYFKVVSREIEPVTDAYRGGSPSVGVGIGGGGNVGIGLSTLFGSRTQYSYAGYLDIVVYDGEKPENERDAYDAWQVIESLKPQVAPGSIGPAQSG